ncbi:MAG TPA: hypothetical protein DCS93_18445 [Microscillaceae bacterium]|nr:hypothetical protein [Microscillaceae bacterium]
MLLIRILAGVIVISFLGLGKLQAQSSVAILETMVQKMPDKPAKVDSLNRLATLLSSKNSSKALAYAREAEKLSEQIHYTKGLAKAFANQGQIYVNIGNEKDDQLPDYEKAAKIYRKAFNFYKALNDKGLISRNEVLSFLEGGVITVYQDLADIYYSEKKDFKQAAAYYRVLSIKFEEYAVYVRDLGLNSAMEELKAEKLKEELLKKDLEKRNLEVKKRKLERDKARQESKLRAAESKQKSILLIASLVSIALILVLAIVLFRDSRKQKNLNNQLTEQRNKLEIKNQDIEKKTREISRNRDEIQDKNDQITESINYAQRIQEAMLPAFNRIQASLPQSFVYYKPRDIVSGDFYWFAEVQPSINSLLAAINDVTTKDSEGSQEELRSQLTAFTADSAQNKLETTKISHPEIIIAAMDCTGHGVPGAFMSMVGHSILNEIVTQKNIIRPDEILAELHQSIRSQLRQKETQNQDGMDACICKINLEEKTLEYAGAHNPLFYVVDNKMHTIKGDRQGVGGLHEGVDRTYTLHTLELKEGMSFYLSSDGYRDQLGGPKDKKFMSKSFKQLLLDISSKTMEEQTQILDEKLKEWMDYPCKYDPVREQTDDILIIGFRV